MVSHSARIGLDWILEKKFLYGKGSQALEKTAQGHDRTAIPGRAQNPYRCDPQGHGLVVEVAVQV